MEVAVPPNNPAKVTSVNDLAKKSVKVALCQPQVPCGVVAAEVFKNAGITVKPVTLQPDVKSVLTEVETGNVDAGMVYVTDVLAAGSKVKGMKIPANDNASTLYPIATINSSKHKSDRPGLRRTTCCHPRASRCSRPRGSRSPDLVPGAAW